MGAAFLASAAPAGATSAMPGPRSAALIRITEVLPDPSEPGLDGAFEWVEVSNVGTQGVPLAGLVLRDNTGAVPLPDVVLPPGGTLLLAGPQAGLESAIALHRVEQIGNGLGNAGDRLTLEDESGAVLDAFS